MITSIIIKNYKIKNYNKILISEGYLERIVIHIITCEKIFLNYSFINLWYLYEIYWKRVTINGESRRFQILLLAFNYHKYLSGNLQNLFARKSIELKLVLSEVHAEYVFASIIKCKFSLGRNNPVYIH